MLHSEFYSADFSVLPFSVHDAQIFRLAWIAGYLWGSKDQDLGIYFGQMSFNLHIEVLKLKY